jgi:Protein of unknown function (DUF3618)
MESTTSTGAAVGATGNGRYSPPPPGTRSAEQIRSDIETQRTELSRSVDALRTRWVEVTDVSAQFRKHRGKILAGAVVAGFVIGGALALGRRRD